MPIASWTKYRLIFKRPAGTSRGVLRYKDSWFLHLEDKNVSSKIGIGECGLLKGLSYDDRPDYESMLDKLCHAITDNLKIPNLTTYPSIRFGLEMAKMDLAKGSRKILFNNSFTNGTSGIPINGLIWMGVKTFMLDQIRAKINTGYKCIKIKIGAINFEQELSILKHIRDHYNQDEITIRVDANGSFSYDTALEKLKRLSEFNLHSIEQPIRAGLNDEMAELCKVTPLPIALDEALIPLQEKSDKIDLLKTIRPQFIILKPSFIGGFQGAQEWIDAANAYQIPWWVTSALESNIGLNAISQWTASLNVTMEQGLGTGQLYENNISSPLQIKNGHIYHNNRLTWGQFD